MTSNRTPLIALPSAFFLLCCVGPSARLWGQCPTLKQCIDEDMAAHKNDKKPKTLQEMLDEQSSKSKKLQDPRHANGKLAKADLIGILDKAARKGWKPNGDSPAQPFPKGGQHDEISAMCSQYFREVMRGFQSLLAERGLGERFEPRAREDITQADAWTDENCNADCFIKQMKKSPEWQEVDQAEVQQLANRGVLVEGAAYYERGSGHLATAFPTPSDLDPSRFPGDGPFIRDGNEHPPDSEKDGRLYPSTWGAVKATKAFDYGSHVPTWYAWKPSIK